MAPTEQTHANTSPGETTGHSSTRAPTQLAVLLASAGTPPLEPEQARLAPVRLWDGFVLAAERARLFTGEARALFSDRPDVVDPRHDALARVVRTLAANLRHRLATYDATHPGADLIRGLTALESARIEGALTGFDLQRGGAMSFTARAMLGPHTAEVDPLDAQDPGVLRRFLALTTRGLMVEKPGSRANAVIADLGGVALALGFMDLFANPRSALRAARARLAKGSRLADDDSARVRDVGQALREILGQAVSSATTSGAAGRDLVKEGCIPPELLDHVAIALARAVYDGLAPRDEHPLVVPGAGTDERFSVAPFLVTELDGTAPPVAVGLYNRIGFVTLPYAPGPLREASDIKLTPGVARPPGRTMSFDEASLTRVRDALRSGKTTRSTPSPAGVLEAHIDAADPAHGWKRATPQQVANHVTGAAESGPSAVHPVVMIGMRGSAGRDLLEAIAASMGDRWHLLVPRPAERTLCIEPIERSSQAGMQLRRADVTRWLDTRVLRSIWWEVPPQAQIVIHLGSLEEPTAATARALYGLIRDAIERTDARAVLLLLGVGGYKAAADMISFLSRQIELETGPLPLRPDATWFLRTDAPLVPRDDPRRLPDESVLADLAEPFAVGAPADLAAKMALLPADARFRARSLRLAALAASGFDGFAAARKTLERVQFDPWSGASLRRSLMAGVACHASARGAIAAGLVPELTAALRHELGLIVAEWDRGGERPVSSRIADLARGVMLECIVAAHARTALVVDDSVLRALGGEPNDRVEPVVFADTMHSVALGVRLAGTLYARNELPGVAPFAVVLRGGPIELCAVVELGVGTAPARTQPAPHISVGWKTSPEREGSLGLVGMLLSGLHALARTWTRESPGRVVTREGRSSVGIVLDVEIDARLQPVAIQITLPLRGGTTDHDAQSVAVEVISHLADLTGSAPLTDWTARTHVDGRGPTIVALAGPMLLRDVAARWVRALRLLSRYFPVGAKSNARYARSPVLATASELGLAAAILQERGINPTASQGRALLSRLPALASGHEDAARNLGALLPLKPSSQDGNAWEVLERNLALGWFFHANFCTHQGGRVQWTTADGLELRGVVEQHVDRTAARGWLQRKGSRPEVVEQRVIEFLGFIEPSIVVGS